MNHSKEVDQTKKREQYKGLYKGLSHTLPRFVVLGLAPEGFSDELTASLLHERGMSSVAIDSGRLSRTVEGVFFGHESAFSGEQSGKLRKLLGRLGMSGTHETEDESIPRGVIVFPKIKGKDGTEVDTPLDQIEALCAENQVPFVVVDSAEPGQNLAQLTEKLLAPPAPK